MKISKKYLLTVVSVFSFHTASFAQDQPNAHEHNQAQREAFKACADSVGMVKPEPGQRPAVPTEEQRTALESCMKEKGFSGPGNFGRPPGGRPPGPPPDGQRPDGPPPSESSAGVS